MKVVTAGVWIRDNEKVFLVRRGPAESLAGHWEFPGGKVELGESDEECLARELKEELAIDVTVGNLLGESHYIYEHGEFLIRAYAVCCSSQEYSLSVHDLAEWVRFEELLNYSLAPADIPIAEGLIEKRNLNA